MKNRNRLLYALVLLPTLLLTSCYKDFDKVRVKPFKPDLVVPLAMADNITFADMLVKDLDPKQLDSTYDDGRIGFRYSTSVPNNVSLCLSPLKNLSIEGGKVLNEELFPDNNSSLEVRKIFFANGAKIRANKDVTLKLDGGKELQLNQSNSCTVPGDGYTLAIPTDVSNDCILTFEDENQSVDSVRVKIETLSLLDNLKQTVTIDAYAGLLWYSGELTDPRVAVKIETEGWLAGVDKLKYWVEGTSVKTMVEGKEEERLLIGREGENHLPFNVEGEDKFCAYWKKDDTKEKEYFVGNTTMGNFSKEWPLSYTVGRLRVAVEDEVDIHPTKKNENKINTTVALKLPITGRFNALIREIKGGDKDGNIELPDVNNLLQDSGSKGGVKSKFTENDTVLLHFYFKNATPMDIYLAARIGENNKVPKGEVGQKASVIEGLNSRIDDEVLKGDALLTIGKFDFFKAVEGADAGGKHGTATGSKSKVATIAIPYSEYEEARKSAAGRQLTALLLFRSPNGTDGQPIVVSPRLTDYVSIRLGVEVKPEVSIELMNKE